jgi:hypothetical protein
MQRTSRLTTQTGFVIHRNKIGQTSLEEAKGTVTVLPPGCFIETVGSKCHSWQNDCIGMSLGVSHLVYGAVVDWKVTE